ncbi:hypothetical protein [Microbacterium sulfonylureivorans]|uniref:hypothetical protein n=1 Tax=Microbacterium sulfonylureivorans TaxID=2486854 RepID=UPI0013DF16F5|nr:hypothetical protein [Microbacterium sulfonylureivorans]
MREHIEILMVGLAASLRRESRRAAVRRLGPRRARGTFVPITPAAPAPIMSH